MRFFIILIVLMLFFLQPQLLRRLQLDNITLKWRDYLQSKSWVSENSNSGFLVLFFLPVLLLVGICLPLIEHKLFGLPYLIGSLFFLIFSLGRKNIIDQFELYSTEWKAGRGKDYLDVIYGQNITVENDKGVHLAARSGLVYRGFESVLCVLFWFIVSGLLIPVVYRLLHILHDHTAGHDKVSNYTHAFLQKIISMIEFVPSLLLALALNVTADDKFKGIAELTQSISLPSLDIQNMLHNNTTAALDLQSAQALQALDLTDEQARSEFYRSVPAELDKLKTAFRRLLMLFLAVSAVFLIF